MATGQEKIRWRDFIIEIIILLITISIVLFFVFFFSPSIVLECIIIIILTVTIIEIILIKWKLKDLGIMKGVGSLRSFTIYNFVVGILTLLSLSFILIFMGISPIPTLIIHKIIYIPTIDTYLSAYWIQHCYGIKYYWLFIYINKSFVNESFVQYFNKSGLPFNNITIKQVQDLLSYTYVYYPAVIFLGSLFTYLVLIIIVAILILILPGGYFSTLKNIISKYDNIREDLCDNGILFRIHFSKSFIIYLIIFWIIVYSSLVFLITSEYPYAYLMLITTFLVIIIEVFMLRESEISDIAYVVLFVGVVATGFFTMLVFYLSSVFLPSTCLLITSHSVASVLKNIKSIYTVLLAFASILGALPYASTLWIVQYRYECSHQRRRQTDTRWFCA
jgi:hypothetical protein